MRASGGPRDDDVRPLDGRHLSEDELNRYIDDDLAPGVRRQATDHLAQCDHCTRVLAELQLLTDLLRALPQTEVPRSFQLDQRYATNGEPAWRRWGASLMPLLPAMRAGTLALAVALGGVTAYRVVDDPAPSRQVQEQSSGRSAQPTNPIMAAAQSTVAEIPESTLPTPADATYKTTGDRDQSADSAAAPADGGEDEAMPGEVTSADDQTDESTQSQPSTSEESADSATGGSDAPGAEANTAMIAMEVGSPAASPTTSPSPTHTPTVTVTPTDTPAAAATPTPTPVPVVATTESNDQSWLGWTQAALGVMLAALGALVVGLSRMRRGMD